MCDNVARIERECRRTRCEGLIIGRACSGTSRDRKSVDYSVRDLRDLSLQHTIVIRLGIKLLYLYEKWESGREKRSLSRLKYERGCRSTDAGQELSLRVVRIFVVLKWHGM